MKVFVVIIAANDAIKAGLSCWVVQYKHNAHCSSLKTSNGQYGRDDQVRKYVYVYYFLICGLHCHQKQVVVPVFIHRLCYQSALSRRNPPPMMEKIGHLFFVIRGKDWGLGGWGLHEDGEPCASSPMCVMWKGRAGGEILRREKVGGGYTRGNKFEGTGRSRCHFGF